MDPSGPPTTGNDMDNEGTTFSTSTAPATKRDSKRFSVRFGFLLALYFAQGLPYGFFLTALPLFLREAGWSRTAIGFYGALGFPWFLKPLWAPLVDRFAVSGLGRRKTWILPCMAALALLTAGLSLFEPRQGQSVYGLLFLVLAVNFLAATQDIAVDGLAVDTLSPAERGLGNVAQVGGFKIGMLTSGGLLVAVSDRIGWKGLCLAMAFVCLAVFHAAVFYPEKEPPRSPGEETLRIRQIAASLLDMARRSGFVWALALILTYKSGEVLVDSMYKIFLLDSGMDLPSIGLLAGTWGMGFSLAGSVIGGWAASGSVDRLGILERLGLVRAVPLAAIAVLPHIPLPLSPWIVYPVTLAEHMAGGLLTPVLFAFLMDLCDRRASATQYTALAAVELLGKMTLSLPSGLLADRLGFGVLFPLAAALSLAWPALVRASRNRISL